MGRGPMYTEGGPVIGDQLDATQKRELPTASGGLS